jgi:hypothetical protein
MAEWAKDELLLANEQVLAATETRLKPGSALEAVYEATEDVAIEFACQRNRMIVAAKDAKERLACEDIAGAYRILNLAIAACKEGK